LHTGDHWGNGRLAYMPAMVLCQEKALRIAGMKVFQDENLKKVEKGKEKAKGDERA
jgi:hypothetical protein